MDVQTKAPEIIWAVSQTLERMSGKYFRPGVWDENKSSIPRTGLEEMMKYWCEDSRLVLSFNWQLPFIMH